MIAVRNSDGKALYSGKLTLTDDGLYGNGFVDKRLNLSNCTLLDVKPPERFKGGGFVWNGSNFTRAAWLDAEIREDAKSRKSEAIINDFKAAVSDIKRDYTDEEIDTWYRQELEARNYRGNPNSNNTPLLDAIASVKGKTTEDLVASVEAKASQYAAAVGQALGVKQSRQEALEAIDLNAPDAIAQIEAI